MSSIWEILEIKPTSDKREIRRAYAALSRTYHVEEFPEEFARIQKAYHAALEYAEDQNADTRNAIVADTADRRRTDAAEGSILSRLETQYQNQKTSYSNREVIAQIRERLMDFSEETESDRQQLWQDFFLSDAFLSVYDREHFAEELIQALSACREISVRALEPVFLSELALVYGILGFDDIGNYDRGNKAAVGNLLLEQDQTEWSLAGWDARRVSRSYSFYSFCKICQLAEEGGLKDYQQEKWGNLSFYAEDNYVPRVSVEDASWQLRLERVTAPHAPACAAMHSYLIQHYGIPENVCHAMRNNFEIDGRLGEYPLCSYQAAYDQMCRKYPQMIQSEAAKLTEWKIGLLSEPPVFTRRTLDVETMEWLMQVWKIRQCSGELTQAVYDAYKDEGDTVLPLLEVLVGRLVECQNQSLEHYMPEEEVTELTQVSLSNQYFWHYFLGAAYPYTSDGKGWRESDHHFALSLYMKQVYPAAAQFVRHFFRKEMQSPECSMDSMHYVLQAGKNEKTLLFGEKEVRVVFTPHHVEYFMEEKPVFYQSLSFAEVSALPESEEGNLTFFLLLPVTKVSADAKCREEVRRRLASLPFYEPTWDYLADCMVRNTDWEPKPDHPQKFLEEVYYSEDAWHCFRGRLTGRKFTVEYKTPKGWYPMKLLHGESKNTRALEDKTERFRFMHGVVDGFLPPEPKPLKEISVEGKLLPQKARAVFDAMLEGQRRVGINFTVTLWFWENGCHIPRLCYMYAEKTWDAANLRLEIMGEQKNAYLNREERLKRIAGERVNIVGFFRVESEDVLPFPVGVGESGRYYTYTDHRLIVAGSYPELITKCVDLRNLEKIEIDDGLRTVDLFTRKLQNWYMHRYNRETKEHEWNYPFEVYRELFDEL